MTCEHQLSSEAIDCAGRRQQRGEKRLAALMKKYGKATVLFYMDEIMNYSERRILAAHSGSASGSFSFEDYLEGDGISTDRIAIPRHRCGVRIPPSCGLSKSDPQF